MPRSARARLALALLVATAPDVHAETPGWRSRPGRAELRGFYYTDNSGLDVLTLGAGVDQPLSTSLTLTLRALADRISVEREQIVSGDLHAGGQNTGHSHAPDVVTSASATVSGGEIADKWRYAGALGLRARDRLGGEPVSFGGAVRASTETDYASVSGIVDGSVELFQRNLTLSLQLGAGRDVVTPVEAPPGERDRWPASHERLTLGAGLSQLLAPRLVLFAGLGATFQRGTLENPYRRAIVRTTLFPEAVPDARDRLTVHVGTSWYLGAGTALHLRQGGYADSWGVLAVMPELVLAHELGSRALLSARYRYYVQGGADFYEPAYSEILPELSGDPRLGPLHEHTLGADLRWTVSGNPGGFGVLSLFGGYEWSTLDYRWLGTENVIAHIASAGALLDY